MDGDPHFVLELPDKNDSLCFNINDAPGTIFNVIRDPELGKTTILLSELVFISKFKNVVHFV